MTSGDEFCLIFKEAFPFRKGKLIHLLFPGRKVNNLDFESNSIN